MGRGVQALPARRRSASLPKDLLKPAVSLSRAGRAARTWYLLPAAATRAEEQADQAAAVAGKEARLRAASAPPDVPETDGGGKLLPTYRGMGEVRAGWDAHGADQGPGQMLSSSPRVGHTGKTTATLADFHAVARSKMAVYQEQVAAKERFAKHRAKLTAAAAMMNAGKGHVAVEEIFEDEGSDDSDQDLDQVIGAWRRDARGNKVRARTAAASRKDAAATRAKEALRSQSASFRGPPRQPVCVARDAPPVGRYNPRYTLVQPRCRSADIGVHPVTLPLPMRKMLALSGMGDEEDDDADLRHSGSTQSVAMRQREMMLKQQQLLQQQQEQRQAQALDQDHDEDSNRRRCQSQQETAKFVPEVRSYNAVFAGPDRSTFSVVNSTAAPDTFYDVNDNLLFARQRQVNFANVPPRSSSQTSVAGGARYSPNYDVTLERRTAMLCFDKQLDRDKAQSMRTVVKEHNEAIYRPNESASSKVMRRSAQLMMDKHLGREVAPLSRCADAVPLVPTVEYKPDDTRTTAHRHSPVIRFSTQLPRAAFQPVTSDLTYEPNHEASSRHPRPKSAPVIAKMQGHSWDHVKAQTDVFYENTNPTLLQRRTPTPDFTRAIARGGIDSFTARYGTRKFSDKVYHTKEWKRDSRLPNFEHMSGHQPLQLADRCGPDVRYNVEEAEQVLRKRYPVVHFGTPSATAGSIAERSSGRPSCSPGLVYSPCDSLVARRVPAWRFAPPYDAESVAKEAQTHAVRERRQVARARHAAKRHNQQGGGSWRNRRKAAS